MSARILPLHAPPSTHAAASTERARIATVTPLHGPATSLLAKVKRDRAAAAEAFKQKKYRTAQKLGLKADRNQARADKVMAERRGE